MGRGQGGTPSWVATWCKGPAEKHSAACCRMSAFGACRCTWGHLQTPEAKAECSLWLLHPHGESLISCHDGTGPGPEPPGPEPLGPPPISHSCSFSSLFCLPFPTCLSLLCHTQASELTVPPSPSLPPPLPLQLLLAHITSQLVTNTEEAPSCSHFASWQHWTASRVEGILGF